MAFPNWFARTTDTYSTWALIELSASEIEDVGSPADLQSQDASASGAASRGVTGSASLTAGAHSVSVSATLSRNASGALESGASAVVGAGILGPFTLSADLASGAAALSGAGARGVIGDGALSLGASTLSGAAEVSYNAEGELVAIGAGESGSSSILGYGYFTRYASGALESGSASIRERTSRGFTCATVDGKTWIDIAVGSGTGSVTADSTVYRADQTSWTADGKGTGAGWTTQTTDSEVWTPAF